MNNDEGQNEKAGGGSRSGTMATRRSAPAWWLEVPESEKAVIRDVVASIRGLKRSKSPHISRAARKWERGIVCFIRFRLMNAAPRQRRRGIISSRASGHNRPDAFQAQG